MASASETATRANIRIEIKNDFKEEMEVDTTEDNNTLSEGEVEEGELSDFKENDQVQAEEPKKLSFTRSVVTNRVENQWTNIDGGFTTGVDIFGKDEQEKLHSRAQRFGLDPAECKSMTDQQLQDLHGSLGITVDDEIHTRFEAIHMYGTVEMSTQDVFGYFSMYGPASIEWINDESCNVVWLDRVSAARAFHGLSSPIAGMPVTGKCDPFKEDSEKTEDGKEDESTGRSILLISKNREIELYDENQDTAMSDDKDKENKDNQISEDEIHVSQIDIPIPPGYWRLGIAHPKAKYILLRFAKRTDKKPYKAERFSEYYKKYGNPNYGGIRGLISGSKKLRMKGIRPEKDIAEEPHEAEAEVVSGNPWGSLAKNWHKDVHERPPPLPVEAPILPPRVPYQAKLSKSILNRLGTTNKRDHSDEEDYEDSTSKPEPAKKSKVPRMRMYADEEEARVEKVKQLKKMRELEKIEEIITEKESRSVPDLRNRIGRQATSLSTRSLRADRIPETVNQLTGARVRAHKPEIVRERKQVVRETPSDHSDDDLNVQQRSKVTVVVKKPSKPTVASTIWSRLDREERRKQIRDKKAAKNKSDVESESNSSKSESSDSDSDSDEKYDPSTRSKFSKALNQRPGFNKDLKSRLGLNKEHKSPLRIEINNDHYKKT